MALLRAFWGPRPEDADRGVGLIVDLMVGLRDIDGGSFGRWFRLGNSRRDALRREVLPATESVARALMRNRRDTDHSVIEELGFDFSVWNGAPDDVSLSLSVHFGCTSPRVDNSVILKLPHGYETRLDQAGAVLSLVMRLWRPEQAHVWNARREVLISA